jgi:hypothetical protein
MYGVPENLDLRPFQGDYLELVSIGPYMLHFGFGKGGRISVSGNWQLKDGAGKVLDQAIEETGQPWKRDCYRVHALLMATVTRSEVDPPRSFTLFFDNGMSMTVFDDSEQYESFSIEPGDILV